jgi:prepilin-type processing-associated H-X9-DG protein
VDVFNMNGKFRYQLAANAPGPGPLQNPWGVIQAPANFGAYSNDLLVGNVAGAGNINVFDPNTGAYLGQLDQPDGTPIAIKGLWDLEFGDGSPHGGKTNWLYFDAGPNHPGDSTGGLFGVIKPAGHQGKEHRKGDDRISSPDLAAIMSASIMSDSMMPSPRVPTSMMATSAVATSTMLSANSRLDQQIDALFEEFDAVLFSLDSNRTAMPNLDALEATVLDRLDALETANPSMM